MRRPCAQFTVRRMIVLVAVLALPMLVISLVNQAREAARDSGCRGQLFQYGFALSNYEAANGQLPAAFVTDYAENPIHTWRVSYLPNWSDHELNGQYDLTVPWNHPKNARLFTFDTPAHFFWCPNSDGRRTKFTNYVAVIGPNTAWPGRKGRALSEITDDLASTILVLEVAHSGIHWMEPKDITLDDILATGLSSDHPQHINALFADFRVRRVRKGISRETLRALLTVNGGEKIEVKDWQCHDN
jgi:hypothetical protein